MKKADRRVFRQLLVEYRARLRGDLEAMSDAALHETGSESAVSRSRNSNHMAELGSDSFERESTLSLLQNDEQTLGLVEAALVRINEGNYGDCLACGNRIPKMRLMALPHAENCVHCASRLESGQDGSREPH